MTGRERRRLEQLEQELLAVEEQQAKLAEQAEFDRLEAKYHHLPEYERMMDAIDRLMDILDDMPDFDGDMHTPIPGSEFVAEAMDAFLERARQLEREEQNGST
jgi:hypothetical protein